MLITLDMIDVKRWQDWIVSNWHEMTLEEPVSIYIIIDNRLHWYALTVLLLNADKKSLMIETRIALTHKIPRLIQLLRYQLTKVLQALKVCWGQCHSSVAPLCFWRRAWYLMYSIRDLTRPFHMDSPIQSFKPCLTYSLTTRGKRKG